MPIQVCARKDSPCVFIGPESNHWQYLSLTNWLTNSCLVNLIDVTLACEDAFSKLVEVVTVDDVDAEKRVGNSLVQIWTLKFGHKTKFLFRLWAQGLVKILKLRFRRDFEAEVWSFFAADAWLARAEVMKFSLGRDSDVWLRVWSWCLVEILKLKFDKDLWKNLWYLNI